MFNGNVPTWATLMPQDSWNKIELPETAPGKHSVPGIISILDRVFPPWKQLLPALIIVAAVLYIYRPSFHGDWLWDDDTYITNNPLLREPGRLWKAWFEPGSFVEYYPIEQSVQWLQWRVWGNNTFGYHLTNVVLHIVSALLVWCLLSKFGLRLAWLGGLLFAIHPVQVESVAWIVELKNTLSLPPFLLAMIFWIDFEENNRPRDYWFALGLFLMAMLCKITMAPFPVLILLYAWWKRGKIALSDLEAATPFFVISFVLAVTAFKAGHTYNEIRHITLSEAVVNGYLPRLALVGLTIFFYFSKVLLPVGLITIFPKWAVEPPSLWQFWPWPVLAGVFYYLWTRRQSWGRHALLGLGFFLIFLSPFLGFLSVSYMIFTWVMAHFLYIPIIGLIGLTIAALEQIGSRVSGVARQCGRALVAVTVGLLVFLSHAYAERYANSITLWTYTVKHDPQAWFAYTNLGDALLRSGRISEAIDALEQTVKIRPDFSKGRFNLGAALMQAGRSDEAIDQFEQVLKTNPDYAPAYNNLGLILSDRGSYADAIAQFEQAIHYQPDYAAAYNNLGIALLRSGRTSEAIIQIREALKINPSYTQARDNLARLQALPATAP
jgi:tetratricopeptide (TPR) repeat protein